MKADPVKRAWDRFLRMASELLALVVLEALLTLMIWDFLIRI